MDVKQLKEKIGQLETKIQDLEKEKASLEGKQSAILEQLKKDFDCSTIDEADVLLKKKDEEIKKLQEEQAVITADLDKLMADNE